MASTFELYEPSENGADCQRLLPLNELSNTVTFFRVTTFTALIDLEPRRKAGRLPSDIFPPLGLRLDATLALPLSALNIAFAEEIRPEVAELSREIRLVAGLDGTFLPSDTAKTLADSLDLSILPVSDPSTVSPGMITADGTKVEILPDTRKTLERDGTVYVRTADFASTIKLVLDVDEVTVTDEKLLFEHRQLLDGRQLRRIVIDDEALARLQMRRFALARIGDRLVRLRLAPTEGQAIRFPFPPFGGRGTKKPAPRPKRPRYEIALLTTIEQDWQLLGYSRGALLSSITLAPREQLSIEVFTFDRLKIEEEQTFGTEFESNLALNSLSRASTAVASEVAQTLGVEGSIKAGASIEPVEVGGSVSVSNEVKTSLDLQTERIAETTRTASERFKATHQVRIVEARETGTETRSTRRLQNPNFSRTLTLNYFEILENYRVMTHLAGKKQWCLLVKNPDIPSFDIDTVLAYEHRLQQVLLSPNYRSGFVAARILKAQQWFEDSQVKEEAKQSGSGPTAGTDTATSATDPIPNQGVFATARSLSELLAYFLGLPINDALDTLVDHNLPRFEESPISDEKLRDAELTVKSYFFWQKMTSIYPDFEAKARQYTTKVGPLFSDSTNRDEVLRQLALLVDGLDDGWLYAVKSVGFDIVVGLVIALLTSDAGILLGPILIGLATGTDHGLPEAIDKARRQLRSVEAGQEQAIAQPVPPAAGATTSAVPSGPPPVPQVFTLQDLARANADFSALQLHLEKHKTFYQNEIWRAEDVNARYERLRILGLTRFTENRLLGFVGNKAIFPLRLAALPHDVAKVLTVKYANFKEEDIKPKETQVTLPTAGVHMESLLGQCDALEPYMQERRAIDLWTRKAAASRAEAEALQQAEEVKRLQARLAHIPPLLDSPFAIVVPAASTVGDDSAFDENSSETPSPAPETTPDG